MEKIALVSVTLNAVNPMMEYFKQKDEAFEIRNYLDSYLLQKVNEEGGINDSSMKRMFQMLANACEDGAAAVLLTCTIFSPFAEHFGALLSKPIICPDGAMLNSVAQREGKTAILCTFSGTIDTTRNLYMSYRVRHGKSEEVDMHLVHGAWEAVQKGDMVQFDKAIQDKVKQLDAEYDQIVLAQISMARAVKGFATDHARLYTSPDSAYEAVREALLEKGL